MRTEKYATTEAIRSIAEWIASVTIATEPVTAPATSLSRISVAFETIESPAARRLRRAAPSPWIIASASMVTPRSQASSARTARPRWLIASFSASVSSAIVRPLASSSGRNAGS